MGSEEFDETDLCFTSSSVVTNLFDEILNYNGQLQPDENNSLMNSEEGLYPLAKWQSFSDWNDVETFLTFLEVVERALLESLFVRNGVIGIGACAVGVTVCSRQCHWNWGMRC
ncbi:hypothetical protein C2G38_2228476 [Gigaspora rosea]|uniref:Uncharacterized protein n=1 Tax=Gigaspora rosea TaxID=44941 RepID=A0A397U572_9GLOM|nr:hypothetical protein C2G38_2228476 [Gigaspora rosea]